MGCGKSKTDNAKDYLEYLEKIDDWKKRRLEKQKLPQKLRLYEEDIINNQSTQISCINPITNSQNYILPMNQENDQKKIAITNEVSAEKPIEIKNEEPDEPIDQSELDDTSNRNYVYIETSVFINKNNDYESRGFGFLLDSWLDKKERSNQIKIFFNNDILSVDNRYAQIVVVEPNTLADKAGLKKGDLVTEINETSTNNLNNEQLRKIIRQRLLLNSISMKVLVQQRQNIETENHQIVVLKPFNKNFTIYKKSNENDMNSEKSCDETEEDDLILSLSPPPVPNSEPPTLSSNNLQYPSLEIKQVLIDNMKSIEYWKIKQEELMKCKYEDQQKQLQLSFKLELNRVKEEEIKRKEQERLKLEKEKLRLKELEIKQREQELKKNLNETSIFLVSPASNKSSEQNSLLPSLLVQEAVQKEDLNALIEKIYTQEEEEYEFSKYEFNNAETFKPIRKNYSQNNLIKSPIQAKTASLGISLENHEKNNFLPSLIDTNANHQVIKKINDSMEFLNNELLNKEIKNFTHDDDSIEIFKMEKSYIEQDKEKLRFKPEKLNKEQETNLKAGAIIIPTNDLNILDLYKTNLQAEIKPVNHGHSHRKHINVLNKNQTQLNCVDGMHKNFNVCNLKNTQITDQNFGRSVPSLVNEQSFMNDIREPIKKKTGFQSIIASRLSNSFQQISQSQKTLNQSKPLLNSHKTVQNINLNQKCCGCNLMLGQGSAMWIEKLGLAFHLICFRCSVCNVTLGNGKEGTDVRVIGSNHLHCNNCFSNDLGLRLSVV